MQFTLRWLVMVVASLAVLMAVGVEVARATRRAREYRQLADSHAAFRELCLAEADEYQCAYGHKIGADRRSDTDLRQYEAHERVLARHYDALAAKYRRAARFPWLSVQADPPAPN